MKKLIILTLISFALAGLGNVFSKTLTSSLGTKPISASGWAMFKELFH
ncbi:MAG: hypothetical protein JWP91_497 [Fibrobacteres bacterium]|nr:hypothetical protein [Fibrobacterota bacterium]